MPQTMDQVFKCLRRWGSQMTQRGLRAPRWERHGYGSMSSSYHAYSHEIERGNNTIITIISFLSLFIHPRTTAKGGDAVHIQRRSSPLS